MQLQADEIKTLKTIYDKRHTDKVVEQFEDEVDKVNDLEYLVRNKERQIEILRAELAESRHLC